MPFATATATNQSTEIKLERLAAHLLSQYKQPIKQQLDRDFSPDHVQEVKRLLWRHLERDLSTEHPKATNLRAVLTSTRTKLEAAIDAVVKMKK